MNYKYFTYIELAQIAQEEEFLLYCDQDSFNKIARHIEHLVRMKMLEIEEK
jgi:hypothetical protein